MARHADRHATGPSPQPPLLAGSLALGALAAVVEVAAQAGATVDHWRDRPPVDPLALALELADGHTHWPPAATAILIATTIACALIAASVALTRLRRPATSADRAARLLAAGRGAHPVSLANANQTAERFGVDQPGLLIARAVAGGQVLYATWPPAVRAGGRPPGHTIRRSR